ncbi:endonuclease iv apn [Cystoisospora suis]|uniref:Endonuclease iv apn n=1 Tax=Cystoisospora suis TaxID=483139 RepID=A0A2C6LCH4_9APIC|nr:endonuclease iv apn [Cystoisospora suis]
MRFRQRTSCCRCRALISYLFVWVVIAKSESSRRGCAAMYAAWRAHLANTGVEDLLLTSFLVTGERRFSAGSYRDTSTGRFAPPRNGQGTGQWHARSAYGLVGLSTETEKAASALTPLGRNFLTRGKDLTGTSAARENRRRDEFAAVAMGKPHESPDDRDKVIQGGAVSQVLAKEDATANARQAVTVTMKREKRLKGRKTGKIERTPLAEKTTEEAPGIKWKHEPKAPKKERGGKKKGALNKKVAEETQEEGAPKSKRAKTGSPGKSSSRKAPTEEFAPEDDQLFLKHRAIAERSRKFLGAHISAAGGAQFAPLNCLAIAGQAFAFFLKNQRRWESPPISLESETQFKANAHRLMLDTPAHVLPHGSYLINLANPDGAKREVSFAAFLDDLQRCEQIGVHRYVFHPGSTTGACTREEGIANVADCINKALATTKFVNILIENMAGQKNVLCSKFEDIRDILAQIHNKDRASYWCLP